MPPNYRSVLPLHRDGDEREELMFQHDIHGSDSYEHDSKNDINANDTNGSIHDFLGKQLRRRPGLILSIMLLLSCTLGHTFTVIYYWENINSPPVVTNNINNNTITIDDLMAKMKQDKKISDKKVQDLAKKQKLDELDRPSLESEKYYNKTLSSLLDKHHAHKEYPIMGKSKPPPPPPPPSNCQTTIMILRHCEKGGVREHCDSLGTLSFKRT